VSRPGILPDGKLGRVPLRLLLALVALTTALTTALAAVLTPGASAADSAATGSTPAPARLWTVPLGGDVRVTRAFDPPSSAYGAGHRGVDLAGRPGQPVLAAGAGVVLFAGMVAGRPVISIGHANGLRTTYEPVDPSVAAGQVVARGSPIGAVATGHAGCPSDACLHWGLRRGDLYLDPLGLLRPPQVRLMPARSVVPSG
jgi:murein DD-endopeptidase MepM/ murein hydrolase activator NlpD